jgi:oxygen-independent coproporphyrinogen-3 oxidase
MTKDQLIQKYNKPGPRYTSYPPVPFWNKKLDGPTWIDHLKKNYEQNPSMDLYVHVPYCESLCYYCGCHRTITKNHNVETPFIEALLKEWSLYQEKLGFSPSINSLHLGGGTPTFLSPENLERLILTITKNRGPSFVGSIEIDPRTCTREHLKVLAKCGLKRISMGIQDFDPKVQSAINRYQTPELIQEIISSARNLGIESINFDLIYGLPHQSLESIKETMRLVKELSPDLIAFYSYAHLPDRIKNQKLINSNDLPRPELKRQLYETGKSLLEENGFFEIGMDHFAQATSYLYEAHQNNQLHRNFMGYVDKKSSILLGLGPSSISDSGLSFCQNEKNFQAYQRKLEENELPLTHSHLHSTEDTLLQEIILDLMCRQRLHLDKVQNISHLESILKDLMEFEADGIINRLPQEIIITELGKGFTRNVAMSFDSYLREEETKIRFSATI